MSKHGTHPCYLNKSTSTPVLLPTHLHSDGSILKPDPKKDSASYEERLCENIDCHVHHRYPMSNELVNAEVLSNEMITNINMSHLAYTAV